MDETLHQAGVLVEILYSNIHYFISVNFPLSLLFQCLKVPRDCEPAITTITTISMFDVIGSGRAGVQIMTPECHTNHTNVCQISHTDIGPSSPNWPIGAESPGRPTNQGAGLRHVMERLQR